MKKRAESQSQTRLRIVEAAMSLHQEVGPKLTSISAIAERAGVERLTVYRHFPNELALFRACSGHWTELNPAPDPAAWRRISDPVRRTESALTSLYEYYGRTEKMWDSILRDEAEMPTVRTVMKEFRQYLRECADEISRGWKSSGRSTALLRAAIAHSVQFHTWQSLRNEKLPNAEIARLMELWFSRIAAHAS